MFSKKIKLITSGSLIVSVLLALGCGGGATNNDQGTSFLASGFFKRGAAPVGGAAAGLNLQPATGDVAVLNSDTAVGGNDGLFTEAFLEVQNRLSRQFIRLVRVDCKYDIPGATIAIPNDSDVVTGVLGPVAAAPAAGAAPGAVATPAAGAATGAGALPSSTRAGFFIVSPDMYSFLNVNRASLPAAPFRMIATCSVTGVSQAGDVFTTNSLNYSIQFVERAECCTGGETDNIPDFQNGPGTGGTITTTPSTVTDTTTN